MCLRTQYTPTTASDGLVIPCYKIIRAETENGRTVMRSPYVFSRIQRSGWIIGRFPSRKHVRKHWPKENEDLDVGYAHAFIPGKTTTNSIPLPPPAPDNQYDELSVSKYLKPIQGFPGFHLSLRTTIVLAFAVGVEAYAEMPKNSSAAGNPWGPVCKEGVALAARALFIPACCTNLTTRKASTQFLCKYAYYAQANRRILSQKFPFLKPLIESYT